MAYRPYPSVDRARHQLDRHDDEAPPAAEPRPVTPFERQMVEGAQAALKSASATVAQLRAAFQPRPVSSEEKTA